MTKQEEIRKGIDRILAPYGLDDQQILTLNYQVRRYLYDEAVVLKVDRELPEVPMISYFTGKKGTIILSHYKDAQQDMLKAGYVAVEPLMIEAVVG